MGAYGGLESTYFEHFLYYGGMVVLTELIFKHFLYWDGVVVLKELIFHSFTFGAVVVST